MPKIQISKTEQSDVVAGVIYYITPKFFKTFNVDEALIEKYREKPTMPFRNVKKQYTVLPTSTDSEIKVDTKIIELK